MKSAAETMRPNPKLDIAATITELGVGEALVSLLDEKGRPGITERAFVVPPASQLGPITAEQRKELVARSPLAGHYEKLKARQNNAPASARAQPGPSGAAGVLGSLLGGRRR